MATAQIELTDRQITTLYSVIWYADLHDTDELNNVEKLKWKMTQQKGGTPLELSVATLRDVRELVKRMYFDTEVGTPGDDCLWAELHMDLEIS